MAYSHHLAKLVHQIKHLTIGHHIVISKKVADFHGMLNLEDVADWCSRSNQKITVQYRAKSSQYIVYHKQSEYERLRKMLVIGRYNMNHATTCSPKQVKELYEELNIKAKLVVTEGMATYFRLEN